MNLPQFTAEASLHRTSRRYEFGRALSAADHRGRVSPALVGRWQVPWTSCEVSCIEVCTRFCHPTGWDCCAWQTRCALNCNGRTIATTHPA
jgi:hypothetical protein